MLFEMTPPAPVLPKKNFENTLEGKSSARLITFERLQTDMISTIKSTIPHPPASGECVFVYTTNQFNTMAFIVWLIRELGTIEELTLSTYSIGALQINTLFKWYDSGGIRDIFLYIATYAKRTMPKNIDLIMAQKRSRPGVRVAFGFNHSKIMLARIGGNFISISGSGNFSENAYNEQYVICNDERVYNFYRDAIRENQPE